MGALPRLFRTASVLAHEKRSQLSAQRGERKPAVITESEHTLHELSEQREHNDRPLEVSTLREARVQRRQPPSGTKAELSFEGRIDATCTAMWTPTRCVENRLITRPDGAAHKRNTVRQEPIRTSRDPDRDLHGPPNTARRDWCVCSTPLLPTPYCCKYRLFELSICCVSCADERCTAHHVAAMLLYGARGTHGAT